MSGKVYDIITNQILEKLKTGVVPWRKPWTAGVPKNAITKNAYRGFNILRLGMEEYKNPHWATYKQVVKLGGHVEKGSTSTMIIFWNLKTYQDKESSDEKTIPMLRYYRVFNIEQTSLCDDKRFEIVKRDNTPIEACENIINGYKDIPKIVNTNSGSAFYNFKPEYINVPDKSLFDSMEEYYSTLFHECTHSTGSEKRLNRKLVSSKKINTSPDYWFEEMIAELGAAMLGGESGIDHFTLDNSTSYIDSFYKLLKNDSKKFIQAASAAQKAVEYIKGVEAA